MPPRRTGREPAAPPASFCFSVVVMPALLLSGWSAGRLGQAASAASADDGKAGCRPTSITTEKNGARPSLRPASFCGAPFHVSPAGKGRRRCLFPLTNTRTHTHTYAHGRAAQRLYNAHSRATHARRGVQSLRGAVRRRGPASPTHTARTVSMLAAVSANKINSHAATQSTAPCRAAARHGVGLFI